MPTDDISVLIERLGDEDRRLDQINGGKGSLAKAMAKELHGDENQCFTRYRIPKWLVCFFGIFRLF